MAQSSMFGVNMWLLIGILTAGLLLLFLLTVGLTGLNVWLFRRRQQRGEREFRTERTLPDGSARPPAGPGLCDRCGGAFPEVFHLPSGTRRCGDCYEPPTDAGPQQPAVKRQNRGSERPF